MRRSLDTGVRVFNPHQQVVENRGGRGGPAGRGLKTKLQWGSSKNTLHNVYIGTLKEHERISQLR